MNSSQVVYIVRLVKTVAQAHKLKLQLCPCFCYDVYMKRVVRADRILTARLQGWPSGSLRSCMRLITAFGSPITTGLITLFGAVIAWRLGDEWLVKFFVAGAVLLVSGALLKLVIRRNRPDTDYTRSMRAASYSFPSGHAYGAVVAYGLWGYLIAGHLPPAGDLALVAAWAGLALAVGYSRIYLGAHYVLDVLAGWWLGVVLLEILIILANR